MAATAHWNEDQRIWGLQELQEYRRMRPLVCTTKEGSAVLEQQDRAAVHYLIRVVETTPIWIGGSENSSIHDIYMRTVMETLDIFTGQSHGFIEGQRIPMDKSDDLVQRALNEWRNWLDE